MAGTGRPRIHDKEIAKEILKFQRAKAQAKYRRAEWAFTFEDWYQMWVDSGVMEHRGRAPHQYCMVRLDPIEAWGPHNCIIVPRRLHLKKLMYETMTKDQTSWEKRHGVKK